MSVRSSGSAANASKQQTCVYAERQVAEAKADICENKVQATRWTARLYGIPRSTPRNKIIRLKMTSPFENEDILRNSALMDDDLKTEEIKSECPSRECELDLDSQPTNDVLFPYENYVNPQHQVVSPHFADNNHEACDSVLPLFDDPFFNAIDNSEKSSIFGYKTNYANIAPMTNENVRFSTDFIWRAPESTDSREFARAFSTPEEDARLKLKIPQYRPTQIYRRRTNAVFRNRSPPEGWTNDEHLISSARSSTISTMLKDVIERTIAEKFHLHLHPKRTPISLSIFDAPSQSQCFNLEDVSEPSENYSQNRSAVSSSSLTQSASASPDVEEAAGDNRSSSGGSCSEGDKPKARVAVSMKKCRPKRGQYRRYNRALLLEAVKAVQQGDMSVHRAGSYYGVPHSTLEYKVKERHLLRQRKALEAAASAASNATSPNSNLTRENNDFLRFDRCSRQSYNSSQSNEIVKRSVSRLAPSYSPCYPIVDTAFSASYASAPTVESSMSHPLAYYRNALPFTFGWPPPLLASSYPFSALSGGLGSTAGFNFGMGMSASDLLKRLQQKAQATADRESMFVLGEVTSPVGESSLVWKSGEFLNGCRSPCSVE